MLASYILSSLLWCRRLKWQWHSYTTHIESQLLKCLCFLAFAACGVSIPVWQPCGTDSVATATGGPGQGSAGQAEYERGLPSYWRSLLCSHCPLSFILLPSPPLPYPTLPTLLPSFPPPSSPFPTPSPLLSPFLLPSFLLPPSPLLSPFLLPSFLLPPSPLLLKHFTGNFSVVAQSSPLELWMEWLGDELPLASLPEAIVELRVLFEKAVGDYLCT